MDATSRTGILVLAAALLAAASAPAPADDLLDAVLRDDYQVVPAAPLPATRTAPPVLAPPPPPPQPPVDSAAFPAAPPAASVEEPPASAAPGVPGAPEKANGPSPRRTSRSRTASKSTSGGTLLDTFAGCCFFLRPVPPEERLAADPEDDGTDGTGGEENSTSPRRPRQRPAH
jgi:hypothetical protein